MSQLKAQPQFTPPTQADAQKLAATTRIIISFSGHEGGFELTMHLRLDIMDRYGKRKVIRDKNGRCLSVDSDESFCYLDAVTLGQVAATSYPRLEVEKTIDGVKKTVQIDLNKMKNDFWNTYYPEAMAKSVVMIFQITDLWLTSPYCLEEFGWFIVQSVKNLESGGHVGCIFMVFEEVLGDFKALLARLQPALTNPTNTTMSASLQDKFPEKQYARMLQALQAIQVPYAQAHKGLVIPRRHTIDRLFPIFANRVATVSKGALEGIGFTDLYDKEQQRIVQDIRVPGTPQHVYSHDFKYKWGLTEAFRKDLFALLDPELARVGIKPVL